MTRGQDRRVDARGATGPPAWSLWQVQGSAPSDSLEHEIIVQSFQFSP